MTSTRAAPYGSWKSPITTDVIVAETVLLSQPTLGANGILWSETRPREGGRNVIVRRGPDGVAADQIESPWNARTRVNEYGGGAYLASDDVIYFSNDEDRRIYSLRRGGVPRPLTPAGKMRYADFASDVRRGRLLCVREDHNVEGTQATTTIVAVPLEGQSEGQSEGQVLVEGSDFYSTPRVSPDGGHLAWLSWDHPNMPWDGTELTTAPLLADGSLGERKLVAGGPEESIFQPEWSPDGVLHFVSDRTGYWNLYRLHKGLVEPLTDLEAEFGRPQWIFGISTYGFDSPRRIVCIYCEAGIWRMASLDPDTRRLTPIEQPYTDMRFLRAAPGKALVLGGSPREPEALALIDLATGKIEVVRRSSGVKVDKGYLSAAERIEFPTARGLTAHANYYAPSNRDFTAPRGARPPLLVRCHGGPTSAAPSTLDLETQFWTSRGFAFVDVNHGGSTGFGRAYRERLNGAWGIVDVEDCEAAARYLISRGLADPARVAIRGGSAGGYTVLRALESSSRVFRAGASYFGIGDLEVMAGDYGHKFEWKYSERLIGPYPSRADLYRERSPVYAADRIEAPVIFFQGQEDVVCPPEQTDMMVRVLEEKGAPYAALSFEHEGHGFRRGETIRRALEAELYFYGRVFGFDPADTLEPIPIRNFAARS